MSNTKRTYKGKEYSDKTRKTHKDVKSFGWTSGNHSRFEETKAFYKKRFEETSINSPWYTIYKKDWENIRNVNYPVTGKDFIKYGYGNGSKKKIKGYKKEIDLN